MPAFLRTPRSIYSDKWQVLQGYSSLEHLQKELFNRHKQAHPPMEFDPAWHIEPTICNLTPNGVELYKWSIAMDKWRLDAVIIWEDQ